MGKIKDWFKMRKTKAKLFYYRHTAGINAAIITGGVIGGAALGAKAAYNYCKNFNAGVMEGATDIFIQLHQKEIEDWRNLKLSEEESNESVEEQEGPE